MRLLWILVGVLMLAGCWGSDTRTTSDTRDQGETRTTTRETPTADGGRTVETVTTHGGHAQETSRTTTEPDAATLGAIGAAAPVLGGLVSAATGTPGFPWGQAIGGALTVAATGWAALKHGEGGQLKKQVEFHRDDADEAYARLHDLQSTPPVARPS